MTFMRSFFGSAVATAVLLLLAGCGARPAAPTALAPTAAPVLGEIEELGEGPKIVEAELPRKSRDILGSAPYDLPVEANTWVEAELDFLVAERRETISRWLERGAFYERYVKRTLASYGLPTDLYHLAMIESGFLPTARSHAGAMGMWQFMPSTGRYMGLRVDGMVDERMDPVRSTHAAARHLAELYRDFGDWALAAAAYNAGIGRITRGMQGFGAKNFWELAVWGDLAEETKHYVPRLYAMTIIGRNRERFGFPERDAAGAGFTYDSVRVDYAMPLSLLAAMGDVTTDHLAAMNPHLLERATPPGTYWVWVPFGAGSKLQAAYLASDFHEQGGHGVYVVRPGDYLGKLAELAGVKSSTVRELNPGVEWDRLQIGHQLELPYKAAQTLTARAEAGEVEIRTAATPTIQESSGESAEKNAARGRLASHVVAPGETLWAIARRYAVGVAAIQRANDLSGATIRPGDALRIPRTEDPVEETESPPRHVVRSGDTLWGIARAYDSTVESIRDANRIGGAAIMPGQTLLIPR